MTTAVYFSALEGKKPVPSKLSHFATRFMNALMQSRSRRAAWELRRHEALLADLGRRQDHSPLFLDQSELLPAKV
ncbi:hypothetical protein GGR34_000942 [Microvirga flocculans]|uniref:Uncharacterized protein n=1 Tax=Microvirga flocculans TaxID=217168 RepID=A0A7W6ID83_9HYPH|nr:hypothetical protein [Microvirga flocculans]MBB4039307.1 hypothetical protein [Microvirga flocculans]